MSFGQGYKPMQKTVLDCGIYMARIKSVEQGYWKSGQAKVDVILEVKGFSGCQPNRIVLSDMPMKPYGRATVEQLQTSWNISMTEFFDAFGIQRGDFNFQDWYGKIGTVTCRPQRNNSKYKELVAGEHDFSPPQNQNTQNAPTQSQQQANYPNDNWSNCPPPDDWNIPNYPPY